MGKQADRIEKALRECREATDKHGYHSKEAERTLAVLNRAAHNATQEELNEGYRKGAKWIFRR